MSAFVTGAPRGLLRAEGLMVLAAASAGYAELGAGWWLFALLFLVPDLSLAGYLFGRRVGALTYNLGYSYVGPLALLCLGLAGAAPGIIAAGLIWAAHIGFDRALGFGLKYSDGFDFTHLGRICGMRRARQDIVGGQRRES